MDYETKIYLDNLIEAVDSPDWWGFGATVFVGIVAAGITWILGRRQNELQEQQLKIQERQNELQEQQIKQQEIQTELMAQQAKVQEHDQYKELYLLIRAIHYKAKHAVSNLTSTLGWSISDEQCIEVLKGRQKEVHELRNRLSEYEVDFELKTDMTNLQYANYYLILIDVEALIEQVVGGLEMGDIVRPKTVSRNINTDEEHIEALLSWTNYNARDDIKESANDIAQKINKISGYNVLQSLEKHCKL
jgi:hypothetical protein